MNRSVLRQAADLSAFPNLIVIYLGMRVYNLRGLATVLSLRRQVRKAVAAQPEGLLLHESFYFSLVPLHIGLRQYWGDFGSLECWARSGWHRDWWKNYVKNPRGTGFWHETHSAQGGIEAVYDAMREPVGLLRFAPALPARGAFFSARKRLGVRGRAALEAPFSESRLYEE
jgi:Domain of unknown function (DUF4188)